RNHERAGRSKAHNALTNWLRDKMGSQQFGIEMEQGPRTVLAAIDETARIRAKFVVLEDAARQAIPYRHLMVSVDLMARQWRSLFGATSGERIGILMPNISATPAVLLSLWAANKVPAVLNYSTGATTMLACVHLAG